VEKKNPIFEVNDPVRPHTGIHAGELGMIKEVNTVVLTPHAAVAYKVRFQIISQFGYADYEDLWYTENQLQSVRVGNIGFKMGEQCAKASQ